MLNCVLQHYSFPMVLNRLGRYVSPVRGNLDISVGILWFVTMTEDVRVAFRAGGGGWLWSQFCNAQEAFYVFLNFIET